MKPLALLHQRLKQPKAPVRIVKDTSTFFSHPAEMRNLKRSLLGPDSPESLWDLPEERRLMLALKHSGGAFDFSDLDIRNRLSTLARKTPAGAVALAEKVQGSTEAFSALEDAFSASVSPPLVLRLFTRVPSMGQKLLTENADVLQDPRLWRSAKGATPELVPFAWRHGLLNEEAIKAMLLSRSIGALEALCDVNEASVIDIFRVAGRLIDEKEQTWKQMDYLQTAVSFASEALRRGVQDLSGSALVLALSAVDPRVASTCIDDDLLISITHEPRGMKPKIATIRALRALQAKDGRKEKKLWQLSFPFLHRALAQGRLDTALWGALDVALPEQGHWDRCHRLRKAVAKHIKRSNWSIEEVEILVSSAGEEADRLLDLLGTKKKPWYEKLAEQLFP
jgi:hypothetical protein